MSVNPDSGININTASTTIPGTSEEKGQTKITNFFQKAAGVVPIDTPSTVTEISSKDLPPTQDSDSLKTGLGSAAKIAISTVKDAQIVATQSKPLSEPVKFVKMTSGEANAKLTQNNSYLIRESSVPGFKTITLKDSWGHCNNVRFKTAYSTASAGRFYKHPRLDSTNIRG